MRLLIMKRLNEKQLNEVMSLAWKDQQTVNTVLKKYHMTNEELTYIMGNNMVPSSFQVWMRVARKS